MSRFSPIDFPWSSTDPDSPCCMCPDAFLEKCIPIDECPQHGPRPDFSLCHDPAQARDWRLENGWTPPHYKSSHQCRICGHWSEGDWSRAHRVDDEKGMVKAQREMDRGCCDLCAIKGGLATAEELEQLP